MRNALSLFFIGTLFTLTMGISVRYNDFQPVENKSASHWEQDSVRKTASVMDNSNCFTILHVYLESQKKTGTLNISLPSDVAGFRDGARKLFTSPWRGFKNWMGKIAKGTKFNWDGFVKGGFKVDYDRVTYYRELYERALGRNKGGFEALTPNSLNIDRNTESVLGFIYAFNRHERKFHWLEQSDLIDMNIFGQRRLKQLMDKLVNQKEFSAKEYDDLMQELMWKLFGKRSKELMEEIIDEHMKDADTGIKELINANVRKSIYELYVREMSSMALEKTTLFMGIQRNQTWWKNALQSRPAQLVFSGLSWLSLMKGLPFLPWFVDTMPRLSRAKLSYESMQLLIKQGPTKEFFETASKELSGRYGKDWAQNSFFITNQRYEKFRVWFQRWVAPALPFIALYYEYQSLSKEFQEANADIRALDAVIERMQQSMDMASGLQDFGIVLVDAYIPEEPYAIPEQRIKELEEVREAHSKRACRQLKSCLIAKMQQMMDKSDPAIDHDMDIEQEMLNQQWEGYRFCKKIRDKQNECSHEALSIMVHSMIE